MLGRCWEGSERWRSRRRATHRWNCGSWPGSHVYCVQASRVHCHTRWPLQGLPHKRQAGLFFGEDSGMQLASRVFSPALMRRQSHPSGPLVGGAEGRGPQACGEEAEGSGHGLPERRAPRKLCEREDASLQPRQPAEVVTPRCEDLTLGFPGGGLCPGLLGPLVTRVEVVPSRWAKVGRRGFLVSF